MIRKMQQQPKLKAWICNIEIYLSFFANLNNLIVLFLGKTQRITIDNKTYFIKPFSVG